MDLSLPDAPAIDPTLGTPALNPGADDARSSEPARDPAAGLGDQAAAMLYQDRDTAVANLNSLKETMGAEVATDVLARAPETFGGLNPDAPAGLSGSYASVLESFSEQGWRSSDPGLNLPSEALARDAVGRPLVFPTDGTGHALEVAQAPPVGWVAGVVLEGRVQVPIFGAAGLSGSQNVGIVFDNDEIGVTMTRGGGVGAGGGATVGATAFGVFGAGDRMDDIRDTSGLGLEVGAWGGGIQASAGYALDGEYRVAGAAVGVPVGPSATLGAGTYGEVQFTRVEGILNYRTLAEQGMEYVRSMPQDIQDTLETVKHALGQGDLDTATWLLKSHAAVRQTLTGR